jgi:hypothetical protein
MELQEICPAREELKPTYRSSDVPASSCRTHLAADCESYFFLATFLVFLAVFFAAVFATFFTAFFAFFAFLAMLPSDVRWLSRCVQSGIELHSSSIHQRVKKNIFRLKEVLTGARACGWRNARSSTTIEREINEHSSSQRRVRN